MEPDFTILGAARLAMSFFSSFKPGVEVLGANLDGDKTLRPLTGVIEWRMSKTKHWLIKPGDKPREYIMTRQHGVTNEDVGGTIGYVEIWQCIPWWRRWLGARIVTVDSGCRYNVLIPGSKEGLFLGMSVWVSVSRSKYPVFGSFLVQSIIQNYGQDKCAEQRFLRDANLDDPGNMLRNPYVFRDLRPHAGKTDPA